MKAQVLGKVLLNVFFSPFLEAAEKTGYETEIIYLKDKKINHFTGCYYF